MGVMKGEEVFIGHNKGFDGFLAVFGSPITKNDTMFSTVENHY